MHNLIGVIFDGLAYGALLFIISVGLSITLGLMGFINLAHGAFAMFGGFMLVALMQRTGIGFFAALPLIAIVVGAASLLAEGLLYRPLYKARPLDQVLLTVGMLFVASAAMTWCFGSQQQNVEIPLSLQGQLRFAGLDLSRYRLFLIGVGAALTVALVFGLERTRFGAQVRASVDNRRTALGIGIPVGRVFRITFAVGSGLAALGGALGANTLGLDPNFAIKYLVYFLLAVVVGGPGSVLGTLMAALLLGLADVLGKYYFPEIGAFVIDVVMIVLLLARPNGMLRRRRAA